MSLRGKIVVLFLGLAILPILVVAGFGYWQASKLAREVVVVALDGSVGEMANTLHQAIDRVDRKADDIANSAALAGIVQDPDLMDFWEAELEESLAPLAYLTVQLPGRGAIARVGTLPQNLERCVSGTGSRIHTVTRTATVGGQNVVLEGGVWLDELVSRELLTTTGTIVVFPRGGETVLLSSSCEDLQAGVPPTLHATPVQSGRLRFEYQEEERVASLIALQNRPWSVAAYARSATFIAPLQQLRTTYWLFVLLLALSTVLAFSMLLNRVVRSLEDLTAAAAQIGDGDLNPWLPPPGRDEVGRLSLAFGIMLERLRRMMQRMDQSGRLAVVGQLTSYLAHEIRNPLSSIRMNLQSLQRDVRKGHIPEDCGEAIDISLREVDRLSGSLTSVLQLGRPSGGPRETVSVHGIVEDVAELLNGECRNAGVRLELTLDAAADRVTAVRGQLKGVFLNLMMNALEAQPEGGSVTIRSALVSSPGRGPTVAVHIRDQGGGVPPDLRSRIFEPFFTTKNQGSGIGLAVALRTVREHGGDLFLAELYELDAGADFVVELPLAAVAAETLPEPTVDFPSWMDAGERGPGAGGPGRGRGFRFRGSDDTPGMSASFDATDYGEVH